MAKVKNSTNGNDSPFGFEAKLWLAADKLRNSMDAEYKHVVLGLIFWQHIFDSSEDRHKKSSCLRRSC